MVGELSRTEPKKRRGVEDGVHNGADDIAYNEEEVYRRDKDEYHNSDMDGVDEDNNDRGDEEFEEFANPEEYDEFVENFNVPSGHCQPCEPIDPIMGSPMECVPYSWKAPEFTTDDVVKDVPSHYPSHSSTGNIE